MNTVKILHCADIHIGAKESFLGPLAAGRRAETLITFERIIDLGVKSSVDAVVIAGDLFDSNNVEQSFASSVLNKIASVPDLKVIFAAGNHDPLTQTSPFSSDKLPDNLFVLKPYDDCIGFEDCGFRIYGRSFDSVYMKGESDFSLKPPKDEIINIMVLHGELNNDLGACYNPITENFMKNSGMDYIALGHVHKRTEPILSGKTYYAYSGCPEGQGFDECDEKGVYIIKAGKETCEAEFCPIAKRRHIRESIDITGLETPAEIALSVLKSLEEKYKSGFSDNLYRIELTGTSHLPDLPEITARLADKVYFVKLKDLTEPYINYDELSKEISLKGLFVKNMLGKIESAQESEKPTLKSALRLGLKAFTSEVAFDED